MDIFTSLIEFFEIEPLTQSATLVDCMNYIISLGVSVFIVCFMIRSLFLIIAMPEKDLW